jgi:hypothetical protein
MRIPWRYREYAAAASREVCRPAPADGRFIGVGSRPGNDTDRPPDLQVHDGGLCLRQTEGETTMALSEQQRSDFVGAYTRVLISAWSNEEFAAKLESDPRAALTESGVEIPAGAKVTVDRSDPSETHSGDLETQVALY